MRRTAALCLALTTLIPRPGYLYEATLDAGSRLANWALFLLAPLLTGAPTTVLNFPYRISGLLRAFRVQFFGVVAAAVAAVPTPII